MLGVGNTWLALAYFFQLVVPKIQDLEQAQSLQLLG